MEETFYLFIGGALIAATFRPGKLLTTDPQGVLAGGGGGGGSCSGGGCGGSGDKGWLAGWLRIWRQAGVMRSVRQRKTGYRLPEV